MTSWLENYKQSHQSRGNRLCHTIGIPLVVMTIPALFYSWKAALGCFVVGWIFQFAGHAIEGKPPAFFADPRYLLVGPYWWVKKLFTHRDDR